MHIKLEVFEGPFDLLFHLIEKNKLDIYDIPISSLTDQYMQYLETLESDDMESLSEFLLMAATLLEIKSKMLLPAAAADEEEADPRDELVSRLLEYKYYKELANIFDERQYFSEQIYFKKPDESSFNYERPEVKLTEILDGINHDALYKIFKDVLNRQELKIDKIRSGFNSVVKDLYTVEDKINHIKNLLFLKPEIRFSEIFRENSSKSEKITTFLAMLELIKMKQITVFQDNIFADIFLRNI